MRRISTSHLIFLVLISVTALYLNWSAVRASATLFNLIIMVPSGILVLALAAFIFIKSKEQSTDDENQKKSQQRALIGDLTLLALFAIFCFCLTTIGFDVATFLFVWFGILLGGEKNWVVPPLFSAIFTLALIKGFGALFPFPMPLLVF
ncbi:tripartite tricarboxylate transporter TctB family protein [Paenalcaligenes hominis]|uniref:tripartite tricarboxylate transporter TctB family protein n=1 Tax=Paenalcaligenes hominis TaxID=643674 RepID=UPI00352375BF